MAIHRLDHTGFVVEDLAAAVAFFVELGMELEGETTVAGDWADRLIGLDGVKTDIAFLRTPDGHSRIEVSAFRSPTSAAPAPWAPVNVPGIPRITFVIDDLDDVLTRLRGHGGELVGEVARYQDYCRYAYVRGPAGVIVGLVEELS
ncbi:VOC family protein [Amycolatopsis sp. SID8362]|uniref:VOC family protein n=1 Tax=Amycolatopsis sp. SID8362 TaxID=2690346 RepID=UPI001370B5A0|nr:VOC family protein [Amycolatopsis sp. SID8362]NBH05657.1 VOC family protein [Amycolatopsis sp. SID8362]NED42356.1 VOC family protein [Amycolatopsis sp. SID8362]